MANFLLYNQFTGGGGGRSGWNGLTCYINQALHNAKHLSDLLSQIL